MKWYRPETYKYIYPLGPKDRDYHLCIEYNTYDPTEVLVRIGWWLIWDDDLVDSIDFEIDKRLWVKLLFTESLI